MFKFNELKSEDKQQFVNIRNNFAQIAQNEFAQRYSSPSSFPMHQKISRITTYVVVLLNFLRGAGIKKAIKVADETITLTQLAALVYFADDSINDFKERLQKILQENKIAGHIIVACIEIFDNKKHTGLLKNLVNSAVYLDSLSDSSVLHIEHIAIYHYIEKDPQELQISLDLIHEIRELIIMQGDLKCWCDILLNGREKYPAILPVNEEALRKRYLNSQNCYLTVIEDFEKLPLLSHYFQKNTLLTLASGCPRLQFSLPSPTLQEHIDNFTKFLALFPVSFEPSDMGKQNFKYVLKFFVNKIGTR